jgi:hypothetical protein
MDSSVLVKIILLDYIAFLDAKMQEELLALPWTVIVRPEIAEEAIYRRDQLQRESEAASHSGLRLGIETGFRDKELPGPWNQERISRPQGPVNMQSNTTVARQCAVINCPSVTVDICSVFVCRRLFCHPHSSHEVHDALLLTPLDQSTAEANTSIAATGNSTRQDMSNEGSTAGNDFHRQKKASVAKAPKAPNKAALIARYEQLAGQEFQSRKSVPNIKELKRLIENLESKDLQQSSSNTSNSQNVIVPVSKPSSDPPAKSSEDPLTLLTEFLRANPSVSGLLKTAVVPNDDDDDD